MNLSWRIGRSQRVEDQLLEHIGAHCGEEMDHVALAGQLGISLEHLFRYLLELDRAGRIMATPRDSLRKPILLTSVDRAWYFFRVSLPGQESQPK